MWVFFFSHINFNFVFVFEMNEIFKKEKTEDLFKAKGKAIKHE